MLGKFLAKEIPKSVLFVIKLSIIVSGCLEDILIFTSGYIFLNLEIIGDKNCTANVSPVEILISPVVLVLFCFKFYRKF